MDLIKHILEPKTKDLGDFKVRRVLPSARQRSVGPFVFFDHMGPAEFAPGQGIDVRPHPHIGLGTVTYLFEGEIIHRDSLGYVQAIQPGALNWMTAGRGIVHSERTGPEARAAGARVHGIQSWIGLPKKHEETDPGFEHHPAESLPVFEHNGVKLRLIAGSAYGQQAPVETLAPMFYLDAELPQESQLELPNEHEERAVYVVNGMIMLDKQSFSQGQMIICQNDVPISIMASEASRVMLLGGTPLDGHRHIYWNFVSSSRERIEQAKDDWCNGRFDQVPGETEFIPLPD